MTFGIDFSLLAWPFNSNFWNGIPILHLLFFRLLIREISNSILLTLSNQKYHYSQVEVSEKYNPVWNQYMVPNRIEVVVLSTFNTWIKRSKLQKRLLLLCTDYRLIIFPLFEILDLISKFWILDLKRDEKVSSYPDSIAASKRALSNSQGRLYSPLQY